MATTKTVKKTEAKSGKKVVSKTAKKSVAAKGNSKVNLKKELPPAVVKPQKTHVSEAVIKSADKEVYGVMQKEYNRQLMRLELIASENIVSRAVMEAQGSVLTNKYAEGYPGKGKRYYGGCEEVDKVEELARERGKKLFKCNHINVQPHSGSQANMAVYQAVQALLSDKVKEATGKKYKELNLEEKAFGFKCLGLDLACGGHLTHGSPVNFSGKNYDFVSYKVNPETMQIDYDNILELAREHKPKLLIAGGSAYPRTIDFKKFRSIADEVGAYLLVDMAHFGGLVAAGLHPSPVPHAHFVTGTTHKTLRGPRGGYIITMDAELAKKIDSVVFPGIQGGPLMHVIAAKAVCFKEALDKKYIAYQEQVLKNANKMTELLIERGYDIVSGGTDTHLFLLNVKKSKGLTGKVAEEALDQAHITTNKNGIPYDDESPAVTSGIRIGTPAITSRGLKEKEIALIVEYIDTVLSNVGNEKIIKATAKKVDELCKKFPIYTYLK